MARKEAADSTPIEGTDTAGVDEPTRHALATDEREAPTYVVATRELFAYGRRAHVPGDLVPSVNVELHGWGDGVRAQ